MDRFVSVWLSVDPGRSVLSKNSISNRDSSHVPPDLDDIAYCVGNLSDWEYEIRIVKSFD